MTLRHHLKDVLNALHGIAHLDGSLVQLNILVYRGKGLVVSSSSKRTRSS